MALARLPPPPPPTEPGKREDEYVALIGGFKSSNQTLWKELEEPGRGGDRLEAQEWAARVGKRMETASQGGWRVQPAPPPQRVGGGRQVRKVSPRTGAQ